MTLSTAIYLLAIAFLLLDAPPRTKAAKAARVVLMVAAVAAAILAARPERGEIACPCSAPEGRLEDAYAIGAADLAADRIDFVGPAL